MLGALLAGQQTRGRFVFVRATLGTVFVVLAQNPVHLLLCWCPAQCRCFVFRCFVPRCSAVERVFEFAFCMWQRSALTLFGSVCCWGGTMRQGGASTRRLSDCEKDGVAVKGSGRAANVQRRAGDRQQKRWTGIGKPVEGPVWGFSLTSLAHFCLKRTSGHPTGFSTRFDRCTYGCVVGLCHRRIRVYAIVSGRAENIPGCSCCNHRLALVCVGVVLWRLACSPKEWVHVVGAPCLSTEATKPFSPLAV